MAGSLSSCRGPTRPRPWRPRTLARPAWSESAPPASASGRNDEDGGFASILVWPDEVEGPVDDARSRYDVVDLSGDPFILACAAGDGALLTARLSGHQIMINGHALLPPPSVVATIPADPELRSGVERPKRSVWTNDLDGRRSLTLPAGNHQELPGDGRHGHGM
jgi:hypothetical protein